MAHIQPNRPNELRAAGGHQAELDTLEQLEKSLPNDYTVFHSVHWCAGRHRQRFGEIDFLVVNQSGDVLLVEQKNGELTESADGLHKIYNGENKSVIAQMHRARDGLRASLKHAVSGDVRVDVSLMLYCPDHRVHDVHAAGLPEQAMVDAADRDELADRIQALLPAGDADTGNGRIVREFLGDYFELVPDLSATVDRHNAVLTQLSGGLRELVDGLEMSPFRLRIQAAAGAGKSLLGSHFFRRARGRGRRPLMLCFNRPLAERLREVLGEEQHVDTFHGFCRHWLEARGWEFEPERAGEPGYWDEVVDQMVAADSGKPPYDALVIDEGQDFEPGWWDVLDLVTTDDADVLWLEDEDQDLFGRDRVPLEGFVNYRTRANYRTPASGARFIEKVLRPDIEWRNELPGMPVGVHPYADQDEQKALLEERIDALVDAGFDPAQIAIVSMRGQGRGVLGESGGLSRYPVRRYTGEHTEQGDEKYTPGDVLYQTLYRFKGQQAPVVILTDLDFDGSNMERDSSRLYCALTRFTVACEILVKNDSPWAKTLQAAC